MGKELINLENFCQKLQQYKAALEEMKSLTADEIQRVSTIGICVSKNQKAIELDAAIFINIQMETFLEKLSILTKVVPTHMEDTFLTSEIQMLQERVLERLKTLSSSDKFIQ